MAVEMQLGGGGAWWCVGQASGGGCRISCHLFQLKSERKMVMEKSTDFLQTLLLPPFSLSSTEFIDLAKD